MDHCFSSGVVAYKYSDSDFVTVTSLVNVLLPVKSILNTDMAIWEDYAIYSVPRVQVHGCTSTYAKLGFATVAKPAHS